MGLEQARLIDQVCDQFESDWSAGHSPRIEDRLAHCPPEDRPHLLLELLKLELGLRAERGEQPRPEEYLSRFSSYQEMVQSVFHSMTQVLTGDSPTTDHRPDQNTPHNGQSDVRPAFPPEQGLPDIKDYEVLRQLGRGGFATVYLARHCKLQRLEAIKVPHPETFRSAVDRQRYLDEASTAAGLDHPHIVPIYHLGQTDDGRIYVASKFIEGTDLAKRMKQQPVDWKQAARLISQVADALHYAHKCELVHRDVKPANILLDKDETPYLADFGLAQRDENQHFRAGEFSGTPAFMAPEQVRGEAHRFDGRTDIWSLGAILYELLTARRPFSGKTREELFDEIEHRDPKPLRMIDDTIPERLEQICLKALSKDVTKRYQTAGDMAADLRRVLNPPKLELWRWALVSAGLIFAAVIMGWAAGWLSSKPEAGFNPVTTDLQVTVWRGTAQHNLIDAVPLHSGDDLQVVCKLPSQLHPALFWFDTAGKLHELPLTPVSSGGESRTYAWPAADKSNVLGGPAGTEVVFVCASRAAKPTQQQVEDLAIDGRPWPVLSEEAIVQMDEKLKSVADRPRVRGPGADRHRPPVVVAKALDFHSALSSRFDVVRGVAFAHVQKDSIKENPIPEGKRQLLALLRDLVVSGQSPKGVYSDELQRFRSEPTKENWKRLQEHATSNRDKATATTERLKTLESDFVTEKTDCFSKLAQTVERKRVFYEELADMNMPAPEELAAFDQLVRRHRALITDLNQSVKDVREFINKNGAD